MKKFSLESDNRGGLLRIVAIPVSSFLRIRSFKGSKILELINPEDIVEIECLPEGYSFVENYKLTDAGETYEVQVTGLIAGCSNVNEKLLLDLKSGAWMVAAHDPNGNILLAGSNNVQLIFERNINTGSSASSLSGVLFTFSCVDQYPAVHIHSISI